MPHTPGKLRPRAWTYPDPFDHVRHRGWHRARAQAHYRREQWHLTVDEWFLFWPTPQTWAERGKTSTSYVLTRIDPRLPWSYANCRRITRLEQLRNRQELARLALEGKLKEKLL